jgi:lipooligosaccharide transport system ATP-binding protein
VDPIVSVEHVRKQYGSFVAVDDASFKIERGQCFGLLGPNGAGKSTLIRMLYGATSRTGGQMIVMGMDPQKHGRALRKRIGVVTQEDALDEQMSVAENMRLFSTFIGLTPAIAGNRIAALLDFLNLSHKANAKIIALSGGMKRRLVFVRALMTEPELLILDEPTTGLDPAVRQLLWDKIRQLKRQGTTILLTTHYMDEAEVLCDRLVVMDRGQVCVEGSPRTLIREHTPGFVALWSTPNQSGDGSATDEPHTASHFRMEAPTLAELAVKVESQGTTPEIIRPSNLEDVFLKVTGRELGSDA